MQGEEITFCNELVTVLKLLNEIVMVTRRY